MGELEGIQKQATTNSSRAGKGSASKGSLKTLNMYNLTKRGLKSDMLTSYTSLKAESTEGREELFSKMHRGLQRSNRSGKTKKFCSILKKILSSTGASLVKSLPRKAMKYLFFQMFEKKMS